MNNFVKKFAQMGMVSSVAALAMTGCATKGEHSDLAFRVSNLEDSMRTERPTTVIRETGSTYQSRLRSVPADMNGAFMAIPTGSEQSSALLIEKHVPKVVNVGQEFAYELYVTNLTENLNLKDVVLEDTLDGNFRFASASPAPTTSGGGMLRWTMANLAPGQTEKVTVRGTATAEGEYEFCATASYTPYFCIGLLAEQPGLQISKTGPASVLLCDEIVYTVVVTNPGSGATTNVTVTDSFPDGVTALDGSRTYTAEIPVLAAGESREFTIRAKANRTGTFTNTATADASAQGLSVSSQNVTTTVTQPQLAVSLECFDRIFLGNQLEYAITVTNNGDAASADTVLVQNLSSCTTFESASDNGSFSGGQIRWNLGTLNAGQSRTVTVRARGAQICTAETSVYAEGVCAPRVDDECQTEIQGIPAILLEVIDVEDPVRVGGETVYVITATNQGSAVGTNITITATAEKSSILDVTGDTAGSVSGMNVTFSPLPTLAPKASATWRIRVRAEDSGDVRFKVIMNSDQLTRTVEETEATNFYE